MFPLYGETITAVDDSLRDSLPTMVGNLHVSSYQLPSMGGRRQPLEYIHIPRVVELPPPLLCDVPLQIEYVSCALRFPNLHVHVLWE